MIDMLVERLGATESNGDKVLQLCERLESVLHSRENYDITSLTPENFRARQLKWEGIGVIKEMQFMPDDMCYETVSCLSKRMIALLQRNGFTVFRKPDTITYAVAFPGCDQVPNTFQLLE